MTHDTMQKTYDLLEYFSKSEVPVHFKLKTGQFRNGRIIELNENKKVLIIDEFVFGVIPLLLEEIDASTIQGYKKKEENFNDLNV